MMTSPREHTRYYGTGVVTEGLLERGTLLIYIWISREGINRSRNSNINKVTSSRCLIYLTGRVKLSKSSN